MKDPKKNFFFAVKGLLGLEGPCGIAGGTINFSRSANVHFVIRVDVFVYTARLTVVQL